MEKYAITKSPKTTMALFCKEFGVDIRDKMKDLPSYRTVYETFQTKRRVSVSMKEISRSRKARSEEKLTRSHNLQRRHQTNLFTDVVLSCKWANLPLGRLYGGQARQEEWFMQDGAAPHQCHTPRSGAEALSMTMSSARGHRFRGHFTVPNWIP